MTQSPYCMVQGVGEEVVLFLHGVGGGASTWVNQVRKFSENYTAGAWDMPGYGRSLPIEKMTFPRLSEKLEALMDSRGWEKVHLVGHSMGGMVAQEFAVLHQDRIRSLTLAATSPAFGKSEGHFQKQFIAARLGPLDAGESMAMVADKVVNGMMLEGVDLRCKALAYNCMSKVPSKTYRAAIECIVRFEQRDNLPNLHVPTLLLAGEYDKVATVSMMEKMATKIAGCQFNCIRRVGHLSYMEDPEGFNSALENFLSTIPK